MSAVTRQVSTPGRLPDLAPPPYQRFHQPTPIIVTFVRFSYAHTMGDNPARKHNYVGRRVEKKTDVTFLNHSTTWDQFAVKHVIRASKLFHWDNRVVLNFAFCAVMKVDKREIRMSPENWMAVRELALLKHESVEIVFSICPRATGEPTLLQVMECSMLETVRKFRSFVMRR